MTGDNWPRNGYPVLPAFLRSLWGTEQLPETVCRQAGLPVGTMLASMDDSIWNRAAANVIKGPLACYLTRLVQHRLSPRAGWTAQVFPFSGLSLDALEMKHLPLSVRAKNALVLLGGPRRLWTWLPGMTARDLFSAKGLGVKSFLEIVTVVEAHSELTDNSMSPAPLQEALQALRARFPLGAISALDPRLKALRIRHDSSLDEALTDLVLAARTEQHQERTHRFLRDVATLLSALEAEPFDEALARLLSVCIPRRHFQVLMKRVGWDGNGGCSLQEAGDIAGLTRERIRQIEVKIKKRCAFAGYFPQLDRAIEVLELAATNPVERPEIALHRAHLTSGEFLPYGAKVAAELCGREVHFEAKMGSRELGSMGGRIEKALKRTLGDLGDLAYVATVEEMHARLLDKQGIDLSLEGIRRLLPNVDTIHWLDDDKTWFWHPAGYGGSRFLNLARKVLAVSPEISLEKLREGIFRHHRCAGLTLPRLITARLLEAAGFTVQGGTVSSGGQQLAQELSDSDQALITILRQMENVSDFPQLLRAWKKTKWAEATLGMWLGNAPFIERVAPSIYALRGAAIDSALVARLSVKRKGNPVLKDYGWTKDRAVWIGLEVTSTLRATSIFHLPSALRRLIGLGPFELFAADHTKVGALKMNDEGQTWGLGPFFTRRGVDVGDILIITLDPELNAAYAQVNGLELLTRFRDGEGKGPRALMEEATRPGTDD